MQEIDDAALLARVIAGDARAFDEFYRRFRKLILSRIVRVGWCAGVRLQHADVADIAADALLDMIEDDHRRLRLYRADGGCSVATWVGIIAASTARGHLRKRRSASRPPPAEPPPTTTSIEERMIAHQELERVRAVLVSLSARDRLFVELYYVRGMSCAAIAREMGVSLATVYSKNAKIKAKLRAIGSRQSSDCPASLAA